MSWTTVDVTVNSSTWTPVTAPFDCDIFVIRNTGGSPLRYSPDNGIAEDLLEAGAQFSIAIHRFNNYWGPRFSGGAPVVYLKMTSGTANIKLTFLR
jgi:hypothetical protein